MPKYKILVTGGSGYIGSHTIIDLIQQGYEVVSIDNGVNSDLRMIDVVSDIAHTPITNYNVDLCDAQAVNDIFEAHTFHAVVHFAALKAVGESTEQPIRYFQNNISSLLNVLDAMKTHGVKYFIFSSSCTVYGNIDTSPVDESTPTNPAESPYGRTKQMGEDMIHDICKSHDIQAILLRYFNPAGAHISGRMGENPIVPALNLVPAITETAAGKRELVKVFGTDYPTRDGSCIRDYIHVMDLAHAHTLACDRLLQGKQADKVDIINLGIGQGVTVLEMIHAFEKVSGIKLNYQLSDRRPGDIVAIYADNSKAQRDLHWQPQFGVEDIMRTAWQWELNRSILFK